MKKIKKIVLFTLTLGLFFACEDAHNIIQKGEFNEDVAYQSVEDMQLVLNEVYDRVSIDGAIIFTSVFTDEVGIGPDNGGQNISDYQFQLNATSAYPFNIWLTNYRVINLANRLIAGSANVQVEEGSEDEVEKEDILAQAYAIRAFAYSQLLTYFSTDMTDDNALGVILVDFVPTLDQDLPRSTNGEIFALIDADLDRAEDMLGTPTGYKFVSIGMINALRARIAAYRGRYTEANTFADAALANAPALANALPAATSPYRLMWQDLAQGEIIWALDRPNGKAAIASNFFFNSTDIGGGAFLDMGRTLFNLYNQYPSDIRRTVFLDPTSIIAANPATVNDYRNNDVLIIDKYKGKAGAPLVSDIKVFRTSELYFIKAEAQAQAGNLTGVATTLQTVRTARNTGQPLPVYASAQEAWADILLERRKELSFEAHRYIDLKRLASVAGIAANPLDRYFRDCEEFSSCSLPRSDYRWTMPIPIEELNGNNAIRSQQNDGY